MKFMNQMKDALPANDFHAIVEHKACKLPKSSQTVTNSIFLLLFLNSAEVDALVRSIPNVLKVRGGCCQAIQIR